MRKTLARQRLVAMTCLVAVLFNAPVLWLVDSSLTLLGLPALYVYMFGVWSAFIAVIAWIVERGG